MAGVQEENTMKTNLLISPASVRKSRLPSPASSPNLSSRSFFPSPPSIHVDSSVLSESLDSSLAQSLTPPTKQKVYQLPPVNSWVPKGESLFTSILDSRSPQVYRRTNTCSKPASYPVSPQPPVTSSPRISWPQSPQIQTDQAGLPAPEVRSSLDVEVHTEGKSPRLLKKCTSFDLERSKPFPNRSSMTSPMLKRKGMSVDETDGVAVSFMLHDSPQSSRKSDLMEDKHEECGPDTNILGDKHVEVPKCLSAESLTSPENTVTTAITSLSGTLSDSESDKSNTMKSPEQPFRMRNVGENKKSESEGQSGHTDSSAESGAKPKTKTTSTDKGKIKQSKVKPEKQKDKTATQKIDKKEDTSKTKPMLKSAKKEGTTSSVKSALISSAAKLKALGKRSPVTLLSYKSHSITIPDQTSKARPGSMSALDTGGSNKKLVHQSESSPTVLQSVHDTSQHRTRDKVKRSATADFDITEDLSGPPSPAEVKKSELSRGNKPVTTASTKVSSSKSVGPSTKQVAPKAATPVKVQSSLKGKSSTVSADSKESVRKEKVTGASKTVKQTQNVPTKSSGPIVSRPLKTVSKSSVASSLHPKKETSSVHSAKELPSTSTDDKRKGRYFKRDSVTSIQSDSSRKSDSVRDCCSCKKNGEKKPDYLHERKRLVVKK